MPSPQVKLSKSRKKINEIKEESNKKRQTQEQDMNQPHQYVLGANKVIFSQIDEAMREIKELKKLIEEKEKALRDMKERNQIQESINIVIKNRFSCLDAISEDSENMDTEADTNTIYEKN